jgi:hypothetical protein
VYLVQFKLRFRNQKVRLLNKGSGEMFKLIIHFSLEKSYLIKKDNLFTEFWLRFAGKHKLVLNQPKHKNFNDKADVLQLILDSDLKNFTLLKAIDRKRKEYTQVYKEDAIDIGEGNINFIDNQLSKMLLEFKRNGLESYDHNARNFLQIGDQIYIVDLDSFEFTQTRQ